MHNLSKGKCEYWSLLVSEQKTNDFSQYTHCVTRCIWPILLLDLQLRIPTSAALVLLASNGRWWAERRNQGQAYIFFFVFVFVLFSSSSSSSSSLFTFSSPAFLQLNINFDQIHSKGFRTVTWHNIKCVFICNLYSKYFPRRWVTLEIPAEMNCVDVTWPLSYDINQV